MQVPPGRSGARCLRRSSHRGRAGALVTSVVVLALAVTGCTGSVRQAGPGKTPWHPSVSVSGRPLRAFTADSWWNRPVPADAPSNPQAAAILNYMATADQAGKGCLHLSGAASNTWGQPVYWAQPGDPEYDVTAKLKVSSPVFHHVRIPARAAAANNGDSTMAIFDVDRGYTVALTGARYDADTRTWSAAGATVTYLASNGLDVRTGQSTDSRNIGSHRGNNAAVMMVRLDEVAAGDVPHVLKVASGPETSARPVFPMVGSDGSSTDPAAPPQGLRFRIKPSVDLAGLHLGPQALVIAKALQQYGFYIGDSSGRTSLKLEDTRTEGRGQLWTLAPTALCGLPISARYWDVLPEGYQPPPSG